MGSLTQVPVPVKKNRLHAALAALLARKRV